MLYLKDLILFSSLRSVRENSSNAERKAAEEKEDQH